MLSCDSWGNSVRPLWFVGAVAVSLHSSTHSLFLSSPSRRFSSPVHRVDLAQAFSLKPVRITQTLPLIFGNRCTCMVGDALKRHSFWLTNHECLRQNHAQRCAPRTIFGCGASNFSSFDDFEAIWTAFDRFSIQGSDMEQLHLQNMLYKGHRQVVDKTNGRYVDGGGHRGSIVFPFMAIFIYLFY